MVRPPAWGPSRAVGGGCAPYPGRVELREGRGGRVTRWAHLGVLLVFAAGFFTMHGFLAVSASAGIHLGQQHGVASTVVTHVDAAAEESRAAGPASVGGASTDLGHAPDRPAPAEHHDLAAGCVVALVGVALAGLTLLLLRRSTTVEHLRIRVSDVVQGVGVSASRWSPPRVALCVIRV